MKLESGGFVVTKDRGESEYTVELVLPYNNNNPSKSDSTSLFVAPTQIIIITILYLVSANFKDPNKHHIPKLSQMKKSNKSTT